MLPHSDLNLPPGLEGLADLALDLRWTVRQTTDKIWELLDAEAWEKTKNPYLILQNVSQARLQEAARDENLIKRDLILAGEKIQAPGEACPGREG